MYTIVDIYESTAFPTSDYRGFLMLLAWLMRFCDLFDGYHTICFRIINVHLWLAVALMISKHYRTIFPQNERTKPSHFLTGPPFSRMPYIFQDTCSAIRSAFFSSPSCTSNGIVFLRKCVHGQIDYGLLLSLCRHCTSRSG